MTMPVLEVKDLRIAFGSRRQVKPVVHGISMSVEPGEILAIVGESGSGKSVSAMSVLGLLPDNAVVSGQCLFRGEDLFLLPREKLRQVRGAGIGMIFQEPMTALNPVLSIGTQMTEALIVHAGISEAEANRRAATMLQRVGIDDAARRLKQYPHEFSGGMRQRVMIAMTMMLEPVLLIADEPTTALDVTIQAQILDLLRDLVRETGASLVLITHDMGVVAEMADRVMVMRHGRMVEEASADALFAAPCEEYTKALLAAVPRIGRTGAYPQYPEQSGSAPVVAVRNVSKTFPASGPFAKGRDTRALHDVSIDILPGETVALVGESGSGKSTLGRAVTRLLDVDSGEIEVNGFDMTRLSGRRLRQARANVQMIFQDPYSSLDPRFTIGSTICEPIIIHEKTGRRDAMDRAVQLLECVGLSADMARRYPHEFSGGQRQRIAIARALASNPSVIVADEPTSALDVSIQEQVLDLLDRLRTEQGIALLFISHDLAVVNQISSRIAVMRSGRILETGPTDEVLHDPRHLYTRALLSAAPVPDPRLRGRKRITALPGSYPAGPLAKAAPGHWVAT